MCIRDRDYTPRYSNPAINFATDDMGSDKAMGGVLLDILIAVSYTHLDVYKRQLDKCALFKKVLYALISLEEIINGKSLAVGALPGPST